MTPREMHRRAAMLGERIKYSGDRKLKNDFRRWCAAANMHKQASLDGEADMAQYGKLEGALMGLEKRSWKTKAKDLGGKAFGWFVMGAMLALGGLAANKWGRMK